MRILRNPVTQFLMAGAVIVAVVAVGTGELSARAAKNGALEDARDTTELLARSVAEPAIPRGLVVGDPAAIDRLDRVVLERLLVDDVQRIKIWAQDGTVLYSDETSLIGQRYELGQEEREVLEGGSTDAAVSDLSRPENRFEVSDSGLLEVYTPITSPEGEPLLFEVYFAAEDIAVHEREIFDAFRPITLGGMGALLLLSTPVLWVLTRRLQSAGEERERLLVAAVEASESERRRIARDLHDGVVQDMAGTAFRLAAAAREPRPRDDAAALDEMSDSLRSGLRALRSLLVEIYPPDLATNGLPAALTDLLAPASGAGIETSVEVGELSGVPDRTITLLWRVAQEAVRNSARHAAPRRIDVRVCNEDGRVSLDVVDDGRGFDPGAVPRPEHFGLRGMRDLIAEVGGTLDVRSAPGQGTTVRLEVARA